MLKWTFIPLVFLGCSSGLLPGSSTSTNTIQNAPPRGLIDVTDATSEQCPNGGKVYTVYLDGNSNNSQDESEASLSIQIVCNGVNGNDGFDTLMDLQRITTSSTICPSEAGLQVSAGLDTNRDHTLTMSEVTNIQVVCDGSNGMDGQDGADAPTPSYSPAEVIMPCGNTVSYKEVLLRLHNGQVLASFSENANGLNTRLSLVPDGTYINTDSSGCVFSLSTSIDGLTRSISWNSQVQLTWPLLP